VRLVDADLVLLEAQAALRGVAAGTLARDLIVAGLRGEDSPASPAYARRGELGGEDSSDLDDDLRFDPPGGRFDPDAWPYPTEEGYLWMGGSPGVEFLNVPDGQGGWVCKVRYGGGELQDPDDAVGSRSHRIPGGVGQAGPRPGGSARIVVVTVAAALKPRSASARR
jgi:hypothetical protein